MGSREKNSPEVPDTISIGENAANVVSAVKDKVEIVNEALPEGVVLRPVYERTDLVDKAVGTAVTALVEGSILVAIVLFLFLGEFRSALVVITALPLAMLIAFIFMDVAEVTANLMSLGGLAIAIGMVVDGSIVITENIIRHLKEHPEASQLEVVISATREVARPIFFSILIIVLVFVPLFAMKSSTRSPPLRPRRGREMPSMVKVWPPSDASTRTPIDRSASIITSRPSSSDTSGRRSKPSSR